MTESKLDKSIDALVEGIRNVALHKAITELELLAAWVRRGDYDRDDARDEIARAIENRARQLRTESEVAESHV